MKASDRSGATRRELLRDGAKWALALPLAGAALAGCAEDERQYKRSEPYTPEDWQPSGKADSAADTGPVTTASTPAPVEEAPAAAPEPVAEEAPEPVAEDAPAAGGGSLITDLAGAAPMVAALQYVNQSTTAGQECSGCQLYTAGSGGTGKCQLFAEGVVKETGWCASWAPRA